MKLTKSKLILIGFFCILIVVCLAELPTDEANQAIAKGDVVSVHGKVNNLDKLEEFIDKVHNGKKDKLVVTTYTIDGDAIIHTLNYNGKSIQYDVDMRRDKYAAKKNRTIEKYEFADIKKETSENMTEYVLYNNDKTSRMNVLEIN